MGRLSTQQIQAVRDALRSSHRDLVAFAETIPPAERSRRSYCTEWSVAQVYSHLGSGAEIGLAGLRSALTGAEPVDKKRIWQRWDSLSPDEMISGFVAADERYLDALDGLDTADIDQLNVQIDDALISVPVDLTMVLRLAEHALHSWDVHVAFEPQAEVDPRAAELVIDLYPPEIVSMVATQRIAGRAGRAALLIEIDSAPRTLLLTFADTVVLEPVEPGTEPACTGRLRVPTPGAWARLLTGRLDDDHLPDGVTSTGVPTLHDLRILLQEQPPADDSAPHSEIQSWGAAR